MTQRAQEKQGCIPLIAGLLIAMALILHSPSLWWGFDYDDFFHQYLLRFAMDWPEAGPWRLYDFSFWTNSAATHQSAALTPWWLSPDFKVSFFRPISSLSIWLDHKIYGMWTPGYHITNLALFAALSLLVFRLYTELGASRRAAIWALAFFALKDIHSLPVDWIANRNEVIASGFVVAMMIAVSRYCRTGGAARLIAAAVLFLCACMSKESGLIGLPLVGFYLLILDARDPAEKFLPRCFRVMRSPVLWIFFVIAVAYLGAYVAAGHGSFSSNYATPWHRTGVYIGRIVALFPLAAGSLFFDISTDLIFTRPQLYVPVLAISSVLFIALVWIFWRWLRKEPLAWFSAGWAAAAMFPMAGVTLSDRLLMSACVGTSLLLGLLMDKLGTPREIFSNLRSRWPAIVFVFLGLVLVLPILRVRQRMFTGMADADRDAMIAADIRREGEPAKKTVVLNSPSALLAMMLSPAWAVAKNDPQSAIYTLNVARRGVSFLRESADTLTMTCDGPGLLSHRYERVFHTKEEAPAPGTVFKTPLFDATILESGSNTIRSVRFAFRENLDAPAMQFLAWQQGRYRRIAPPAIGATLHLPEPEPTVNWSP